MNFASIGHYVLHFSMAKVIHQPLYRLNNLHGILTVSPQMEEFFDIIQRVAKTNSSVLIRGETGTGKELAAQALHNMSGRSQGPWQAVNCATLTSDLLASELFGHVKGAFTGAINDRKGLFSLADGGSLFLDEVAEISMENQARLLRVLQERMFVPVGAVKALSSDVRLISATNKSLREEVEKGRYREDLMYRIRVVKLFLPRLVHRQGDIEALTWHFIDVFNQQGQRTISQIESLAMDAILAYSWPGNVRELINAIEGAFAIGDGPVLRLKELPPEISGESETSDQFINLRDIERQRIIQALHDHGRKTLAATALGMSRSTLWRKMREYGLLN